MAMIEGIIEPLFHKALSDADHRRATHFKGLRHLFIRPSSPGCVAIDFQQNACMCQLTSGRFARRYQLE
jgi:hypothetical protein